MYAQARGPFKAMRQQQGGLVQRAHFGLLREKFFALLPTDAPGERGRPASAGELAESQLRALCGGSLSCRIGDADELREAQQARAALLLSLGGICRTFSCDWRYVSGLGMPHPTGLGLLVHPSLGVPFISSAALKGVMLRWLEDWADDLPGGWAFSRRELIAWMQPGENKDGAGEVESEGIGAFALFEGIPTSPVTVERDVFAPHFGKWPLEGGTIENLDADWERVPADWHSPSVINWTASSSFEVHIGLVPTAMLNKHTGNGADRTRILKLVMEHVLAPALEVLGVGGLTSAGYGKFTLLSQSTA